MQKKTPMPCRSPEERRNSFLEVAKGYTHEMAVREAGRCLNCKNMPCVSACPVNVAIPSFISRIKQGDISGAYEIISQSNLLPAICGRVCPQESQCESKCIRGIKGEAVAIGRLERYVADSCNGSSHTRDNKPMPNGHKVAVVGSGPSGLTCAGELARMGYSVTVFEALHRAGGVLVYGIPEFRLPKTIVENEISKLVEQGVEIKLNTVVGKTLTVEELMSEYGYEAVFIGSGAGLPSFMNIPGENLKGVYSANEFLTRVNLMKAYEKDSSTPVMKAEKVAVVGGGNVAMDSARCALRLGAKEVYIIYRRGRQELPARAEEVENAEEEGIVFRFLNNPIEILGDETGFVKGIKCVEMELGEPDASGRRRPQVKENSEHIIDVDCVIMAIGTSPNPLISSSTERLETNQRGCIVVNAEGGTTAPGVYAGGDAVTGSATVILAMGAGKKAAEAIDKYIKNK